MKGTALYIAIGAIIASLAAGANAKPAEPSENPAAMTHWEAGVKLFQKKRYIQASSEFAQGYALSHKAGFLFNMAECARLLGDKHQAHDLYRRYLTQHPQGKLRGEALARCQELDVGPCEATPSPAATAPKPSSAATPAQVLSIDEPRPSVPPEALPPPASVPAAQTATGTRPFYKRWPFWAAVGAVVVAGSVTAGVLASRSGGTQTPPGDYTLDFGK